MNILHKSEKGTKMQYVVFKVSSFSESKDKVSNASATLHGLLTLFLPVILKAFPYKPATFKQKCAYERDWLNLFAFKASCTSAGDIEGMQPSYPLILP